VALSKNKNPAVAGVANVEAVVGVGGDVPRRFICGPSRQRSAGEVRLAEHGEAAGRSKNRRRPVWKKDAMGDIGDQQMPPR
jgi:hypothetical protein